MSIPSRFRVLALASLSSLLILNSHGASDVAEEIEVEFSFFYRATPRSKAETKQFTLKVPLVEGDVPEISLGISKDAQFKNMSGSVLINYNSIHVHFMGEKGLITASLFQIDKTPTNSFSGGHGFTGLHYVYDTSSDAQIQFFARVQDNDNEAEQDGADQPATAPELKSEGEEEPNPESEGRSQ